MSILRFALPALVSVLLITARPADGQAPPPAGLPPAPAYGIERASQAITVDGVIDEPDWAAAQAIPLPWEITPGDNSAAPVETTCWMVYDAVTLYFACRAEDPDPQAIRAHLAERDNRGRTIQDDHIVFLLDPFNDERRGFEFRVNTLGVQMDAILSRAEGVEDFAWNADWDASVRITDRGYDLEVGIPFSSLRFPDTDEVMTWGLIIDRSYPRSVRHRMRSAPLDRNTDCLLCHANKITGFQGIRAGSAVEATPTMTASRVDVRDPFPGGNMKSAESNAIGNMDPDFGLDVRWGLTTSMSLNGTINPDFSQVEADIAQLAENRRFALFFPETRPFFLEGADFFLTPIQAVFSRSIVDPDGGIKLTGKEGGHAIGVLAVQDAQTNLIFPSNQNSASGSLEQASQNAILRYRRDVGPSSYVGALYSGRFGTDYRNQVVGADAFHRLTPSNSLRLQLLASATEYPADIATAFSQPAGSFDGIGAFVEYQHFSRDWVGSLSYSDLGEDFRADAGFLPRVDTRVAAGSLGRIFRGTEGGWFTRLQAAATFSRTEDHGGTLTDQSVGARFAYDGPLQSSIVASPSRRVLLFSGTEHDLNRIEATAEIRPTGSFNFLTEVRFGDFVDFANNRRSLGLSVTPLVQMYVGRSVALSLGQTHQRLSWEGSTVYTANLTQARALYHFSVRALVRAVVQYRRIDRVTSLYVRPVGAQVQRLFTQLLFSYKVSPQTALYLGYSDGHEGSEAFDLERRTRTFFVKLGYAFQP